MALDTLIIQIEIGRLIDRDEMFSNSLFNNIITALNDECDGLTSMIRRLAWAPGLFCIWVFAYIIFDTSSDTLGIKTGMEIAASWLLVVIVLKGSIKLYMNYKKKLQKDEVKDRASESELDNKEFYDTNPMYRNTDVEMTKLPVTSDDSNTRS